MFAWWLTLAYHVRGGQCYSPVQILFSLDAPSPYPSPVSSKPQATTDDDISRDDVYTKNMANL